MGALLEPTRARWFTPEFRESDPGTVERLIGMIASTPPVGYAGCCDALAAYDASSRLGEIGAPTRVIAGAQDPVITPEVARALTAGIPDADLVVIEDASHIANVAQPERFNAAVREHLERTL
jgi:pimeloyl-ACP methyl ester carboxylesterase